MVEALRRYFETEYVADPDSPIVEVVPYYQLTEHAHETPLDAGTRFDVVGLDADGHLRAIGEAERANNDVREAAVKDYEQIATINPAHALWVASSRQAGHDAILTPLANPPKEDSLIRSYDEETRIRDITGVDAPGITAVHTLSELRSELTPPTLSADSL
jgi:hypothetical protein